MYAARVPTIVPVCKIDVRGVRLPFFLLTPALSHTRNAVGIMYYATGFLPLRLSLSFSSCLRLYEEENPLFPILISDDYLLPRRIMALAATRFHLLGRPFPTLPYVGLVLTLKVYRPEFLVLSGCISAYSSTDFILSRVYYFWLPSCIPRDLPFFFKASCFLSGRN